MKSIQSKSFHRTHRRAGFTLLEISVVIGVIAIIATMAIFGISAWRSAANKSTCVQQLRQIQTSMRSYSNMNNLSVGGTIASTDFMGATGLLAAVPVCPAGGTYTHAAAVPAVGVAFTTCSVTGHAADAANLATW